MPAAKRKPVQPADDSTMEGDVYRVEFSVDEPERLAEWIERFQLDVGPVEQRGETRALDVTVYATLAVVEKLRAAGAKPKIHENMSAVGRERQKEVGRGDRFEGGKIPPRGLGKKTRQEG